MRRILFDSLRARKRLLSSLLVVGPALLLALGCQPKVQSVSVDAGGGFRKGSPPMCYQYKGEARPAASAYDIVVHLNNTCSYQVDCVIYDDVTEQEHRVSEPPYAAYSLLLAENVPAKRVDLKLECTWKP